MNGDALSDLVLASVCLGLAGRLRHHRIGVSVALGLIGFAALLGVLRYSGFGAFTGAHRFASLWAACGAFPLLAFSLRFPEQALANQLAGSLRFVFIVGGLGLLVSLIGFTLWSQAAPALSALWLLWTVLKQPTETSKIRPLLGMSLIFASFAVNLFMPTQLILLGFLNQLQVFHYCLAAGFFLLLGQVQRSIGKV